MRVTHSILLSLPLLAAFAAPALAAPDVVASIKPIHSLVAAVMQGVGEPVLLVNGSASPHTYALRPSDAAALESADVVFWTGHGMEQFLVDPLATLAGRATVVELSEVDGIDLLPVRDGGAFEPHEHEGEHDDHAHEEDDPPEAEHEREADHEHEADLHFWLDPANAVVMVRAIVETLSAADPDNADAYRANGEAEIGRLGDLTAELTDTLAPVSGRPFIVFHDAYQYFERRFDLEVAGSITVSPEVMPGLQRTEELRTRIGELGPTCVFAEPQFEPAIVAALVEGTQARAGVLDPEGGALEEGPGLYATLLRGLASSLRDCLDAS